MIDLLQTSINGDLACYNGDLVFGNSDTQNVHDLINDNIGEWKQYPNVGLGIINYLNSNMDNTTITQAIRIQLQNDGFDTSSLVVTTDNSNSVETIDVSGVKRI